MPYIKQKDRKELDAHIRDLARVVAQESIGNNEQSCGRLNYAITKLMHLVLEFRHNRVGYAEYNELIGMLECAKLELYRRSVANYEDEKILENGDV